MGDIQNIYSNIWHMDVVGIKFRSVKEVEELGLKIENIVNLNSGKTTKLDLFALHCKIAGKLAN